MRALPVEFRPARPSRAHDGGVQGRHRRTGTHAGVLREHRRRGADRAQRLLGDRRLRDRPPRRRQVLHERRQAHSRAGPPAGAQRLPRHPDLPRRCDGRGQRLRARTRLVRHGPPSDAEPSGRGHEELQALRRLHALQHPAARRVQGHRRQVRCAAPAHAPPPVREGRRQLGRPAPAPRAAARAVRLAGRARRWRAHRRFVLPPLRLRAGASGPQPVRRRTRRVSDRPSRRCVRVPVRDPRRVPRGQRADARRVPAGLAGVGAVPSAATAAVRRGVHVLRLLRHLQGRLHGREVLHRAAARRTGSGMRPGLRRGAPEECEGQGAFAPAAIDRPLTSNVTAQAGLRTRSCAPHAEAA